MTRHRVVAGLRIALGILAACLVAWTVLVVPTTAQAADAKPDPKNAATVGLNTASAKGEDKRGVFDYEVLPRGVVQDWIAVTNYRDQPITVRLFAKDATSSPNSGFDIQASADTPRDIGAWISLKKDKITLPPHKQVVVPFQLGVPFNATPGDHAGAIVVSLLAKEPKPEGGSIIVDHRLGMKIHLRVPGDLKPALSIENPKVSWHGQGAVLGHGDATVTYTVRNTGNVRMNATGGLNLTRVLGMPAVGAAAPAVEDLLPGGIANYTTVVKNVFGTGPMKAKVSLHGVPEDPNLKANSVDVTQIRGFSAWPWLLIALVLGLLLLAGAGGWYERRRRRARTIVKAEQADAEEKERASAKHRMLVRAVLATLAPVVALGAVLVPALAAPANAADGDQWKATISKKQGIALEPFDIETSGGCPKPATAMVGFGYGRGFPKAGAVVVSNTEGGVTNERGFTAALVDSMKNIMALQPDPRGLSGEYKFVIRCIKPEFPDKSYGEYVAGIKFDSLDHWVALPPLSTTKGPVVQITTTGKNGEPKSAPGGGSSATPGQGSTAGQGGASTSPGDASQRASALLGNDSSTSSKDSGPSWLLMGLGIVVLLGSLALAFGRRIPGPWRRS